MTGKLSLTLAVSIISAAQAFLPSSPPQAVSTSCIRGCRTPSSSSSSLQMSFMADSSDYKADKSDFGEGGEDPAIASPLRGEVEMADVPVTEEIPVPMSRNNVGNRFLAIVMDRSLSTKEYGDEEDELWGMHNDRIALTEDHVLWTRKLNLYNDTFNTDSMADVLWSHQLLSSDLQRTIGHAMCIDSASIEDCQEALSNDPIIQSLLGVDPDTGKCDTASVPLYRWRQIRDHTLRRDDGRDGIPTMVLAFDRQEAMSDRLREEITNDHLEYLIRSERVIAAGPLHVATTEKTDPKSIAMGTLILFNAVDREDAVSFVENDPSAMAGLYGSMTVHRYNSLDVTGKFVSENLYFPKQNTYQMNEALGHWGYPVDDLQTKWLNW